MVATIYLKYFFMGGTLQKPTKHYDVTTTLFHYHIFSLSKPKKKTMK